MLLLPSAASLIDDIGSCNCSCLCFLHREELAKFDACHARTFYGAKWKSIRRKPEHVSDVVSNCFVSQARMGASRHSRFSNKAISRTLLTFTKNGQRARLPLRGENHVEEGQTGAGEWEASARAAGAVLVGTAISGVIDGLRRCRANTCGGSPRTGSLR